MSTPPSLPGLNCGMCGLPTCEAFSARLAENPALIKRCIHLELTPAAQNSPRVPSAQATPQPAKMSANSAPLPSCAAACRNKGPREPWTDSLGREYDFVLCHFPEDPGPREIILPHNPILTRELDIQPGDVMIGRPLGMSCGCPITHCGVVRDVDKRTGVITWCVTGPLRPRAEGFKDIGFYSAEAYEGMIKEARTELKIGARYYFQPEMCMLQWRHSGLVNFLNRTPDGLQVRVEGLWIG